MTRARWWEHGGFVRGGGLGCDGGGDELTYTEGCEWEGEEVGLGHWGGRVEHSAVSGARAMSWMPESDGHLAYLKCYSGKEVHLGDDGGGLAV